MANEVNDAIDQQKQLNDEFVQGLLDFFFSTILPITEENRSNFLKAVRKINKFRRRADEIRRKRLRQAIDTQRQFIQETKDLFKPSQQVREQQLENLGGLVQNVLGNINQNRLFGKFTKTPIRIK